MITGEIVDCLVSYFGFDDDGGLSRYFCYHVIGGPGPTPGGGAASAVLLAIHDPGERCVGCQSVYLAPTGGAAAAVEEALRYLDAYHQGDRLRKVQTPLRGLPDDGGTAAALNAGGATPSGAERDRAPAPFPEFIYLEKRGEK